MRWLSLLYYSEHYSIWRRCPRRCPILNYISRRFFYSLYLFGVLPDSRPSILLRLWNRWRLGWLENCQRTQQGQRLKNKLVCKIKRYLQTFICMEEPKKCYKFPEFIRNVLNLCMWHKAKPHIKIHRQNISISINCFKIWGAVAFSCQQWRAHNLLYWTLKFIFKHCAMYFCYDKMVTVPTTIVVFLLHLIL